MLRYAGHLQAALWVVRNLSVRLLVLNVGRQDGVVRNSLQAWGTGSRVKQL